MLAQHKLVIVWVVWAWLYEKKEQTIIKFWGGGGGCPLTCDGGYIGIGDPYQPNPSSGGWYMGGMWGEVSCGVGGGKSGR